MRVVHALPALLGKHFYKQKKIPIGVDLRHLGWKEQVERVSSSGMLFLGAGTCSVVRVARLSMSPEEIAENVAAAIEGVVETAPRGWSNVRSLHLKLMDSVALPVYQTVPDVKLKIESLGDEDEEDPRPKKGKKKEGGQEERKMVKKKKKGSMREVRYMDMESEEEQGDGDDEEEDTNNHEENEDEDLNVEMKKRKQEKEIGSENGVQKKKKLNGIEHHEDVEDVAELGDDKPSKKLSKLRKQGKVKKEEGDNRTKIASSVGVSKGKKEMRKKGDKLAKVKPSKE
ncbi:hypothetical protein MLD38_015853 [Melastoma candidum]|nr:hypothetical protein MLD38_015853 [Melastoma candidum]